MKDFPYNETRERIYEMVREQPGITMAEICRAIEKAETVPDRHVHIMERWQGRVTSRRLDGRRFVFAVDQLGEPVIKHILRDIYLSRFDTRRGAYDYIEANPGATQASVRRALNMKPNVVWTLLNAMERNGFIKSDRVGRHKMYEVVQ